MKYDFENIKDFVAKAESLKCPDAGIRTRFIRKDIKVPINEQVEIKGQDEKGNETFKTYTKVKEIDGVELTPVFIVTAVKGNDAFSNGPEIELTHTSIIKSSTITNPREKEVFDKELAEEKEKIEEHITAGKKIRVFDGEVKGQQASAEEMAKA